MLMPALFALYPQESMFEPPAAQIRFKLLAHETGQWCILLTKMGEEPLGVLLDNLVEQ